MKPDFERVMAEATRLTQAGDLLGATAAIQAALARTAIADLTTAADDVIDIVAREVVDAPEDDGPVARRSDRPGGAGAGRFVDGRHTEGKSHRDYKLYIPPNADGQALPLPLVVMLHGCTQNPDDFAAGTRMNEAAQARGFYVLYPAQSKSANPSGCWNWFKHNHQRRGRGEPALLAGMTRAVMQQHGIDAKRVYVAGLSAGGAMAAILGAAYPETYAAVGVHSGLAAGAANDLPSALAAMQSGAAGAAASGRTPPTIVFHGDQDTTVHPSNGAHAAAASAGRAAPERSIGGGGTAGRTFTQQVYRDEAGRAHTEHWTVHGSGHAWSGGSPRGSYTDAQGPDATAEMLRFFFTHSLPEKG